MTHISMQPKPVPFAPEPFSSEKSEYRFVVEEVSIVVQKSQFEFDDGEFSSPDKACWFLVKIMFPNLHPPTHYGSDEDLLITNGEVYHMVNHSLPSNKRRHKRIHLNDEARTLIDTAIQEFVGTLR